MASEDSSFDLQSLLADAQDLVDESFVARALLQPETDPWERFPLGILYPTEDPFNEIHHSSLCDSAATSLAETEPAIKAEPVEDAVLTRLQYEPAEHLDFTQYLKDPASNSSTAAVSSSSSPTEDAPFTQPDIYLSFTGQLEDSVIHASPTVTAISSPVEDVDAPQGSDLFPLSNGFIDQLDYLNTTLSDFTPAIADFNSFSATTAASPHTPIVSSRSPLSSISSTSSSELPSSNVPSIDTEDLQLQYSTITVNPDAGEPEPQVCYTFVDPHEKPRKRRAKGVKNSTPIACTFCRRRKIRCGGPQESGGVYKSCIRLNHKGECVFPAVSYRGQRLGGSAAKRKSKDISKHTSHSCKSP